MKQISGCDKNILFYKNFNPWNIIISLIVGINKTYDCSSGLGIKSFIIPFLDVHLVLKELLFSVASQGLWT